MRATPSSRGHAALAGPLTALALAAAAAPATAVTTTPAGLGLPFDNAQPSLVLNLQLPAQGANYPQFEGGADATAFGIVRMQAGFRLPFGGYSTNGQLYDIQQNPALFSVVGTAFGGNGLNNFRAPDLGGRALVGLSGTVSLGEALGERSTRITVDQLPSHTHALPGGLATLATGGGQPISNLQASLGMRYLIAEAAPYPNLVNQGRAAQSTFVGQVVASASGRAYESGFLEADGRLLPIAEHETLFSVIGTTYGGDGVRNFALPDLRGRTVVGVGNSPFTGNHVLGQIEGSNAITLSPSQMALHNHGVPANATGQTGGFASFDNMQASLALQYLVAVRGTYPQEDCCIGIEETMVGEVTAYAGSFVPDGWLPADGRLLSINQNQALFSLLGTTYGGDGRTSFALPDLRGRTVVGAGHYTPAGANDAAVDYVAGTTFGVDIILPNVGNLPSHVHALPVPEPETWALLLAGLGLTAAVRRRRSA